MPSEKQTFEFMSEPEPEEPKGFLPLDLDVGVEPFDVPGFEQERNVLAEEFPELNARLDRLGSEAGVDFSLIKERLGVEYMVDRLGRKAEEQSDTALVEIANMQNVFGDRMFLDNNIWERSEEEIEGLYGCFGEMCAEFVEVEGEQEQYNCMRLLQTFARNYTLGRVSEDGVKEVATIAKQVAPDWFKVLRFEQLMSNAMVGKGLDGQLSKVWDFMEGLYADPNEEIARNIRKSDVARNYFITHGLDEQEMTALKETVFPLMEAQDPEVDALLVATNAWGMQYGDYGIADYRCKCLISEVNPRNMNELLLAQRELPTSELRRFEQNRRDAIAIQNVVIGGRDFIHDERPGTHELLKTMVEFYDAQGERDEMARTLELQKVIAERLNSRDAGYYGRLGDYALNIENYDAMVSVTFVREDGTNERGYNEPAITVLRRLVENTDQQSLEAPETKDETLNELMQKVEVWKDSQTGVMQADFRQTGELVKYVNGLLLEAQGNVGIWPSTVEAVAYTERMATLAMRGISRKDWRELPYDENFKEMVKFRDLTGSAEKFSEGEFEEFWRKFSQVLMEDGDEALREHYQMLQQRVLGKLNGLAKEYAQHPGTARRVDELWSGNLNHEMIGLTEYE